MSRCEYEMTNEQSSALMQACQTVPMIALQCGTPSSPQENANRAWQALGKELGFVWDSVEPVPSKGPKFFTAETARR